MEFRNLHADFMYRYRFGFANGDIFWHLIHDLCIMCSEGLSSEVLNLAG